MADVLFAASQYDTAANQALARRRGIIGDGETIADCLRRVHASIVAFDEQLDPFSTGSFGEELAHILVDRDALPGTPILSNAGRHSCTVAACTVIQIPRTIAGTVPSELPRRKSETALTAGIGTGYDLSECQNPVMELERFNAWLLGLDQRLLQQKRRPVASMFTLDARHPDIKDFIRAKDNATFSKWRANISVVFRGNDVDDLFESLLHTISESAHRCGEPGVLFFDTFEADNPTPDIQYVSTAPCAEVAMAPGELCHFWYVNLERMVRNDCNRPSLDWERIHLTVAAVVRALDAAVQMSIYNGAERVVAAKRRIGVGVAGFHAALIRLGIAYASAEAEALAGRISEWISYCAHRASAELAKNRGPFPIWPTSRFRDFQWLQRKSDFRTGIVGDDRWDELHHDVINTGIRHASVVAYPPTGMSSELLATSKSYEPFFALTGQSQPDGLTSHHKQTIPDAIAHRLQQLDPCTSERVRSVLSDIRSAGNLAVTDDSLLATAREISVDWHLRIHAAFQRFSDESGAKTVNVPGDTDLHTIKELFKTARQLGLKGITVFRDGCLDKNLAVAREGSQLA